MKMRLAGLSGLAAVATPASASIGSASIRRRDDAVICLAMGV